MPAKPMNIKSDPAWAKLGLSLVVGGALIGGTFLGSAPVNAKQSAGTYALNILPDNYGTTDLAGPGSGYGIIQAQDSDYCYYYYGYYGCCYYSESGDYCCYDYGYYYCYDDTSKRSNNNLIESGGFTAIRPTNSPVKKPVNVGGFTAIDKEAVVGSMAVDGGGFSGAGKQTDTPNYNNTFL